MDKICIEKKVLVISVFLLFVIISIVSFSNILLTNKTTQTQAFINQVAGGTEALPNEFPFFVALYQTGSTHPFCGGALIDEQYVLTAAHCLVGTTSDQIWVLIGPNRIDSSLEGVFISNVNKIILYKENFYLGNRNLLNKKNDDIALIKLTKKASNIPTISIPIFDYNQDGGVGPSDYARFPENKYINKVGIIMGFGDNLIYSINNSQKNRLIKGFPKIYAYPKKIPSLAFAYDDAIAESDKTKTTICPGDSGGPFIVKGEGDAYLLIGIASTGACHEKESNLAGQFTSVAYYGSWIQEKTGIRPESGTYISPYKTTLKNYPSQTSQLLTFCGNFKNQDDCYLNRNLCKSINCEDSFVCFPNTLKLDNACKTNDLES